MRKLVIRRVLLLSFFALMFLGGILSPFTALAAPNVSGISGSVVDGGTVLISGENFGARPDFDILSTKLSWLWWDFETTLLGEGLFFAYFPSDWNHVSGGRPGQTKYARRVYANNEERGALSRWLSGTTGEYFVSFWFMIPPDTQAGKIWRIYGSGPAASIYTSTGCENRALRGVSECSTSPCVFPSGAPSSAYGEWDSIGSFTPNTWHRVDFVIDQSPDEFSAYIDGELQWTRQTPTTPAWIFNPFGGDGHTIDLGHMLDAPNASRCSAHPTWNGSYNYDDYYVDFTKARLELCDASTWSNRAHCEIQIPTTWSAVAINAKMNQGSFLNGTTAYLYVVDVNGLVNATGYPVVVSSGGGVPDTISPSIPTGFVVM